MLRKLPSKHSVLLIALLCIVTMTLPTLLHAQAGWIDLGNAAINGGGSISTVAADVSGNIYAAGSFVDANGYSYVARWSTANGGGWREFGYLKANNAILSVTTDAAGNIYAAGDFTDSSGHYYVAKWDVWHWVELGGVSGSNALMANGWINTVTTDAAGNVYAAGNFTDANGYSYVAKWNGSTWVELGTGSNALKANAEIYDIAIDGSGNIYAGGFFTDSTLYRGSNYVAKWNGTNWSILGGQVFDGAALTLNIDNTGNIYAAGYFTDTAGYRYVAKWNGTAWVELGGASGSTALKPNSGIYSLTTDSTGNVYAAGGFTDGSGYNYVAKWNGTTWGELGTPNLNDVILSIAADNAGNIYAGGNFIDAQAQSYVAKWNSTTWGALGNYTNPGSNGGTIDATITDIHGKLYAAGGNSGFGSRYVVKWDGVSWANLSAGTTAFDYWSIRSLATDSIGNIYGAGNTYDSYGHRCVVKWSGTNWTELGTGSHALHADSAINAIASDAEGRIYAGGNFKDSSGNYYVAKWDGTNWTELGGGSGYFTGAITSVVCNNTGTVYATGNFIDGGSYYYVAYWNGSSWSELGALNANGSINSITLDAAGNVYAAGNFMDTYGNYYVAMWNGSTWSELGTGSNALNPNSAINSITADIAGNIYAAGLFTDVNAFGYVAKWNGTNWSEVGGTSGSAVLGANSAINTLCTDIYGDVYAAGAFTDNAGNDYVGEYLSSDAAGGLSLAPPDLINRVSNSAYIFEGQVIQSKPYWTAGHGSINTVHLIQTSKMFKGQLTCGTVELITMGGTIHDTTIWISHNQTFVPGQTGIFMCNPTQLDTPTTGTISPDNIGAMQLQDGMNSFIGYFNDGVNAPAADMWRTYDSLPLLYAAVQQFVSYSYTTCEPEEHIIKQKFMPNRYTQTMKNKILQSQNNQNKQQQINGNTLHLDMATAKAILNKSTPTPYYKGATRSAGTFYYDFINAQVTGTGPYYLEFDIDVSTDYASTDYFWQCYVDIQYDTAVFGINATAHATAEVDPMFSDACSVYALQDDAHNVMGIGVEWDSLTAVYWTYLPYYPDNTQPLFHVRMLLEQCLADTLIMIDYNGSMSNNAQGYSHWVDQYDVNIANTLPVAPYCPPSISNFTPAQVNAGVGDIVTIHGYGFGTVQGSGGVYLTCADNPNIHLIVDSTDLLYWSDNEIRFRVASVSDSGSLAHNYAGTMGSDDIIVYTDDGYAAWSNVLYIYYAISNYYIPNTGKFVCELTDQRTPPTPDIYGYLLRVDTSLSNYPKRYSVFKSAVRQWRCLTHVKFEVGDTIHSKYQGYHADRICTVQLGTMPYANEEAYTTQSLSNCNGKEVVWEFDLIINRAEINKFVFDTTGRTIGKDSFDGYHIILHELGHAHSLGHIMDNTKMMYWSSPNTGIFGPNRVVNLTIDAPAYDGAMRVLDSSQADTAIYASCIHAMRLDLGCTSPHTDNVSTINNSSIKFQVYPNPVNGILTIKYEAIADNNNAIINIYNAIGENIYKGTLTNSTAINLSTSSWATGLYIVNLQSSISFQSFKIIKQ